MSEKKRWLLVVVYAIAMAWLESATVLYQRQLNGRLQPYQSDPLPVMPPTLPINEVEMVREAGTLVMLLAVGWLGWDLVGLLGPIRVYPSPVALRKHHFL